MAVLISNPIGLFRIRYDGIKPCRNPDYFNALISFLDHTIPGVYRPELCLHSSAESSLIFQSLKIGSTYTVKASIGVQQGNQKDGKTYPARVSFKIVEIVREEKQAA